MGDICHHNTSFHCLLRATCSQCYLCVLMATYAAFTMISLNFMGLLHLKSVEFFMMSSEIKARIKLENTKVWTRFVEFAQCFWLKSGHFIFAICMYMTKLYGYDRNVDGIMYDKAASEMELYINLPSLNKNIWWNQTVLIKIYKRVKWHR